MMSGQNPHPGDMHHSQIPVGCLTPPPSGLTLIGALHCVDRPGLGFIVHSNNLAS